MRRGPTIGGHLPHVSKTALEQMTSVQRWEYHGRRADIFAARARFFGRLAVVLAVISLAMLLVTVALWLTG